MVADFPGGVSDQLARALWSAYTALSLLRRSSAIALLENAVDSTDSRYLLSGDSNYLLGTAFLLRNIPLISLQTTHHLWFRGERTLSVPVVNESSRPVHQMILTLGACHEAPNGRLGAATNDGRGVRLVHLRWKTRLRQLAPLGAGRMRMIKVNLRTVGRVEDHPLLFLVPRIKCKYGHRAFRLTRDEFPESMTVKMLPSRSALLKIIEHTRRRANTHEDLIRLLRERVRKDFNVALSPPESEQLYRAFFPDAVTQWLQQFERSDRPLIQKLVDSIVFYRTDDMRQRFKQALLRPGFRDQAQQAIFVGVGEHEGKSGPHLLMYVKHAYKRAFPEKQSDEIKRRFTHPAELPESIWRSQVAPFPINCVVFVDDFFGSGKTVCKFLAKFSQSERDVYRWIWRKEKYLLAISGFQDGRDEIVKRFPELEDRFIVSRLLRNCDKAFSPKNSKIFRSDDERKRAEHVCRKIGEEILRERARRENLTDKERKAMALGWDNDQALIRFEHNTPNNTLPIIWEGEKFGKYKGKRWIPLYPRHD